MATCSPTSTSCYILNALFDFFCFHISLLIRIGFNWPISNYASISESCQKNTKSSKAHQVSRVADEESLFQDWLSIFFTSPTPKSWGLLCGKVDGMHNYILILSRLFNILAIFIHWIKIKKNRSFLAHISSSHYVISVRIFLPWDPHISDNLCQNLSVMRSKKKYRKWTLSKMPWQEKPSLLITHRSQQSHPGESFCRELQRLWNGTHSPSFPKSVHPLHLSSIQYGKLFTIKNSWPCLPSCTY